MNITAIKVVIKRLEDQEGACKQSYLSIFSVYNTVASSKISVDKPDLNVPQERYHWCIVTQRRFNPDGFIVEVTVKRNTLTVFREL